MKNTSSEHQGPVISADDTEEQEWLKSIAVKMETAGGVRVETANKSIQAVIDERNEQACGSLITVHNYLTNEEEASIEGRQTTAQQLNNAKLLRQIAELEAAAAKRKK